MGSAATSTVAQTEEGEFVLVPQPRNERLRRSQPPFQGLGFEQKAGRALCFPAMYVIEATWKFPGRSWSNDVLMLSGGAASLAESKGQRYSPKRAGDWTLVLVG
eukprot:g32019.t2